MTSDAVRAAYRHRPSPSNRSSPSTSPSPSTSRNRSPAARLLQQFHPPLLNRPDERALGIALPVNVFVALVKLHFPAARQFQQVRLLEAVEGRVPAQEIGHALSDHRPFFIEAKYAAAWLFPLAYQACGAANPGRRRLSAGENPPSLEVH